MEHLTLQDFLKLLHVQSLPATAVHSATAAVASATPKKQRTVLSCRHTDDDLKCGNYEYITEDCKFPVLFVFNIVKNLNYCKLLFHFGDSDNFLHNTFE